jgi:hypothetical protein
MDCLRRDTTLTNRGLRQKDRGTRVTACAHHKQAQVDWGWWEGRAPQRGAFAQPARGVYKTRQGAPQTNAPHNISEVSSKLLDSVANIVGSERHGQHGNHIQASESCRVLVGVTEENESAKKTPSTETPRLQQQHAEKPELQLESWGPGLQQEAEQAGEDTENHSAYKQPPQVASRCFRLTWLVSWTLSTSRQVLKLRPCGFVLNKHRIPEAVAPAPHREISQQKRSSGHWAKRRRAGVELLLCLGARRDQQPCNWNLRPRHTAFCSEQPESQVKSRHIRHKLLRLPSTIAPAKGAEGKCTP